MNIKSSGTLCFLTVPEPFFKLFLLAIFASAIKPDDTVTLQLAFLNHIPNITGTSAHFNITRANKHF